MNNAGEQIKRGKLVGALLRIFVLTACLGGSLGVGLHAEHGLRESHLRIGTRGGYEGKLGGKFLSGGARSEEIITMS